MSARILVVDDNDINLRLLEARLRSEFFEVVTATNGPEALAIAATSSVDLVLLDVMMPGMDGYEVCRRLKAAPETAHVPVVLVTALDQPADRVAGLEAGADDFLTKPARDLQLFSRVKSLARLKRVTDELRERAATALVVLADRDGDNRRGVGKPSVLLFGEDARETRRIASLLGNGYAVSAAPTREAFLAALAEGNGPDIALLDFASTQTDALRLLAAARASGAGRHIPTLVVARPEQEHAVAKALELGATDYILRPLDRNELAARVRTQVRRKRYEDRLRRSVTDAIALAVTDPLTGLHNRRFFDMHLDRSIGQARAAGAPLSIVMADIDHFKRINDGWGHDVGDAALRQFAGRLRESVRGTDLACRFGGEEFVVLMPQADAPDALGVAERIRQCVAATPFDFGAERIGVTVSVGVAVLGPSDDGRSLLNRTDRSLYEAKRKGRNTVFALAA